MSNKLEQVAVRLEPELRERLQRAADQDRRPLAGMIRKILHDATKQGPEAGVAA
jgi:predicted DNA-binding protein